MRSKYIKMLAQASETEEHELVLECMSHYEVSCTQDLSQEQLENFCKMKGLVIEDVR